MFSNLGYVCDPDLIFVPYEIKKVNDNGTVILDMGIECEESGHIKIPKTMIMVRNAIRNSIKIKNTEKRNSTTKNNITLKC